jgi:hypothetical protein
MKDRAMPAAAVPPRPLVVDRIHNAVARRPLPWRGGGDGEFMLRRHAVLAVVRASHGQFCADISASRIGVSAVSAWFDDPHDALAWCESYGEVFHRGAAWASEAPPAA